jgi:hypothetical protein
LWRASANHQPCAVDLTGGEQRPEQHGSGVCRRHKRPAIAREKLCEILNADTRAISKAFSQIPYATEQGIISAEQGILAQEQGILPAKTEIIAG